MIRRQKKSSDNQKKSYSVSDSRIRGIYSNRAVSLPLCAMQALLRCSGNRAISTEDANFPINSDRMSPKCREAFPK